MSISKIHKMLENRACAIGCFGFMALAFAISALAMGPQCGRDGQQQGSEAGPVVARVGNIEIPAAALDSNVVQRQRQLSSTEPPGPADMARLYAEATQSALDAAYVQLLARQQGVEATEASAEQAIPSIWNQQVQGQKDYLELTGQLKSGATEKDFEAFMKGKGMDLAAERTNFETVFAQRLKDPGTQLAVLAEVSGKSLLDKIGRGIQATDEDVKAGFDTYVFKRILLSGKRGDAGKAAGDKIVAEIKAGSTFEAAMEKHSSDVPVQKEKKGDRTDPIPVSSLRAVPELNPLLPLKVGEVSAPIDQAQGTTIYKLIKVERKLPDDFAKKQAEYRKGYVQSLASAELQKQLAAFKKANPVQWESKALAALASLHTFYTDPNSPTGEARTTRLREIAAKAKAAGGADPTEERIGALAYFAAIDELWNPATPTERVALADERIASMESALQGSDNVDLRIELVDLYAQKKQGEKAYTSLLEGARANLDPREAGQRHYYMLSAKLALLKKEALVNPEQEKSVQAELDRWRASFEEMTKFEAEEKVRAEAEKKRFEEAQKKAAAAKPAVPKVPAKGG